MVLDDYLEGICILFLADKRRFLPAGRQEVADFRRKTYKIEICGNQRKDLRKSARSLLEIKETFIPFSRRAIG